MANTQAELHGDEIAIIGRTGRFPHAEDLERFWQNLRDGHDAVEFFSDEQLLAGGLDPSLLLHPNFVRAGSVLENADLFDASFFGYTPREADIIDPQHRLLLESCWHALETAGYDPDSYPHRIGVYASASPNSYLFSLYANSDVLNTTSSIQLNIANEKDHLCTRVSYKLNLRGPSICVQTACSSSLVAVHLACQALLNGECEMALAGGVSVRVPQESGYFYQEGGISSPDGHCRAFDAKAQGTRGGNGVGVVVLKRLEEALADGDTIRAVIKGSAINNDGSHKVGYTAPSVQGQAEVIADALAMARVDPATISYVEAHGTGTPVGDPVEVRALTKAFRAGTQAKNFCALGSVKSNVGHLDAAAGITGLIKTVLALEHGELPPTLHFVEPNPQIDFDNSPFYVCTKLARWERNGSPRRAGVSSFGAGGTNAHVVVEEAPAVPPSEVSKRPQLLLLSARTEAALERATANLADYLERHPGANLADVAYTLKVGRRGFGRRRALVCDGAEDALRALREPAAPRVVTGAPAHERVSLAVMFPGQGTQYPNMTRGLYEAEPAFRAEVDLCAAALGPHLGLDLRAALYPAEGLEERAARQLAETAITQPALFVVEYALAKLWMSWGVRPEACIGHSIGEYVAACLAGVFTLEDALRLVAARGRLMQRLERGAMLAVGLPEAKVESLLGEELSLAAVNGPSTCVVSGATAAVEQLEQRLKADGAPAVRLHTSHAFHSAMMEPVLAAFAEECRRVALGEPRIPYVSNVTGQWMTTEDALDAGYWVRHLRQTVRFADGMSRLLEEPGRVLLEVGPGETLCRLAKSQRGAEAGEVLAFGSLRGAREQAANAGGEVAQLLQTQGRLWAAGVPVNWSSFYSSERRRRLPLPPYPFERQRHWVEPTGVAAQPAPAQASAKQTPDEWFYLPVWRRSPPPRNGSRQEAPEALAFWLVFADSCGLGERVVEELEAGGARVVTVKAGPRFARTGERAFALNPRRAEDYERLIDEIDGDEQGPLRILHLWSVTRRRRLVTELETFEDAQPRGFYSLLRLVRALGNSHAASPTGIGVVTSDMHDVTGEEVLAPEKATVIAACRVVPQEYPNISCRSVDVVLPPRGSESERKLARNLIAEMSEESAALGVAYRGGTRWLQSFERFTPRVPPEGQSGLREGGVYLITGGLGGVGGVLAEHLAKTARARLVLVGRSWLPAREDWPRWLAEHPEDDATSGKIRKVHRLEELGAEVLALSADVAERGEMEGVLGCAAQRFGALDGVIHAAGNTGDHSFQNVQQTGQSECEWQFRPKARGAMVLAQLLSDTPLDFCMMASSLSTVLGGFGLVAYSAANAYLDAFTHKQRGRRGLPWMTVNWDGWNLRATGDAKSRKGEQLAELALTPAEGVSAFERLVPLEGVPQVVVSTGDLDARIRQWVNLDAVRDTVNRLTGASPLRPRPALQTEYVAPHTQVEKTLAEIWQSLLGIERVGLRDNFFELGGHSLLALSMTAQVYDRLGQEVTMATLFEEPTIEHLAQVINARGWPGVLHLVDKMPRVFSPLVKIRPGGTKPPLFFAAPLGGVLPSNVLVGVLDLARHLDDEQPFYGLQLPGLVQDLGSLLGPAQPLDAEELQARFMRAVEEKSAREMIADGAAQCVRAIRHIQPHGPYMIGGFCTGGLVALEVAQHLRREGEEVALLALIDTNPPPSLGAAANGDGNGAQSSHAEPVEAAPDVDAELDSIVWFVGRDLSGGQLAKELPEMKEEMRGLSPAGRWEYALEQMRRAELASPETTAADIERLYTVYQINTQTLGHIVSNYTPETYPGKITLFRTEGMNGDGPGGWHALSPTPPEVYTLTGDHGTLFLEPHIHGLVKDLTRCLDAARAGAVGPRGRSGEDGLETTAAGAAPPAAAAPAQTAPAIGPPPRVSDALVLQLMDVWHDVLSRRPAALSENFFEVGGDRRRAEQLVERIRVRTGHSLTLAAVTQNPTIEKLAALIYRARGWPWQFRVAHKQARIESPLITIQPVGMKRPFFFAAPLGGVFPSNVVSGSILSLLPHLDPERPYYGLQLPGLAQELAPELNFNKQIDPSRIRRLCEQLPTGSQVLAEGAARCVRAIREVQPDGPYFIGGFCTGGLLAHEIASQLQQQGERVSLLAYVDTFAPGTTSDGAEAPCRGDDVDSEVAMLVTFLNEVIGADRPLGQLYEYLLALEPRQRWQHVQERALARALVHPGEGIGKIQNIFQTFLANRQSLNIVLASYQPSVYEGRIRQLVCDDLYRDVPEALKGWGRYSTGPLDLRLIPAHHRSLFGEPEVRALAESLGELFEEAERECGDDARAVAAEGAETTGEGGQASPVECASAGGNLPRFVTRSVTLEETYSYQVYLPANYTPEKQWPVILSLHGASESGDDGEAQTRMGLGLALRKNAWRHPFIVVMPQCRENSYWWDPEMEAQAMVALEQTIEEMNGDRRRLYLTGFCSGGFGAWVLAARYYGKFAGLAPMASASPLVGATAEENDLITQYYKEIPVWIFHGERDGIVDVAELRKLARALKEAGAPVRYTEYKGIGHGSWVMAYEDPDFFSWLMSCRLPE